MSEAPQMQEELEVFCLGRFQLRHHSQYLNTSAARSNKTWLIFKLLLTLSQRMVATDVLVETFWPDSKPETGRQALYTCVHRLRAALSAAGLPDLIVTEGGFYGLNPEIPVWIDAQAFESLVQFALTRSGPEREESLKEALKLYKGDFLSEHLYDDWAQPAQIHYRSVYRQAVMAYADFLIQQERHKETRNLLEDALIIEPFEEEFHVRLLETYWQIGAVKEAALHYNRIHALLYHEYGVRPSPRMQQVFHKLRDDAAFPDTIDLETLQKHIGEMNERQGAFFCNREEFQLIGRLEQRKLNRSGKPAVMASIAVKSGDPVASSTLLMVLEHTLRQGDIITQWNDSLFMLLFPETSNPIAHKIMRRVHKRFQEEFGSRSTKLQVRLKSLPLMDADKDAAEQAEQ